MFERLCKALYRDNTGDYTACLSICALQSLQRGHVKTDAWASHTVDDAEVCMLHTESQLHTPRLHQDMDTHLCMQITSHESCSRSQCALTMDLTASAVCDTALPVQGDFGIRLLRHHHPWQSRNDPQQVLHSLNAEHSLATLRIE